MATPGVITEQGYVAGQFGFTPGKDVNEEKALQEALANREAGKSNSSENK